MTSNARSRGPAPRRFLTGVGLALALPSLAACQSNRDVTSSIHPEDHAVRHPIVLADAPRVLDVFVEGSGRLAPRQGQDLAAFLAEYRQHGKSGLIAQIPVETGTSHAVRRALDEVQAASGSRLAVQTYRPADPAMASPIRLSFKRLQAKVGTKCGLWPHDLGVGDADYALRNQQYWNLGCATQSNLASQVADPVDLVRGRQETPPDTGRRMFNIGQLRTGVDPSTAWKEQNNSVRSAITQ
jgi:pilus assembly protein CpaD